MSKSKFQAGEWVVAKPGNPLAHHELEGPGAFRVGSHDRDGDSVVLGDPDEENPECGYENSVLRAATPEEVGAVPFREGALVHPGRDGKGGVQAVLAGSSLEGFSPSNRGRLTFAWRHASPSEWRAAQSGMAERCDEPVAASVAELAIDALSEIAGDCEGGCNCHVAPPCGHCVSGCPCRTVDDLKERLAERNGEPAKPIPALSPTLEAHKKLEGAVEVLTGFADERLADANSMNTRLECFRESVEEDLGRLRSLAGDAENRLDKHETDLGQKAWREGTATKEDLWPLERRLAALEAARAPVSLEADEVKSKEWHQESRERGWVEREGRARGMAVFAALLGLAAGAVGALAAVGLS